MRMNLEEADRAPDLLLNEIVWRSVRGADNPMPAPMRASWVRALEEEEDEDEEKDEPEDPSAEDRAPGP
jgi:hypothetical protein